METLRTNPKRIGSFTSSEIVALTKTGTRPMTESELEQYKKENPKGRRTTINVPFGSAAITYIEECNMEIRSGLPLTTDTNARPLSWGKIAEYRAFNVLGLEYKLCSQETIVHPTINCWSGSPDGLKNDDGQTVFDIKSPITRKSFFQLHDCKTIQEVIENHPEGETYYYQLVSNAILTNSKWAELIAYMPYKEELNDIRAMIHDPAIIPEEKVKHYYWLDSASEEELPYILKGGYYSNIHIIRFEVTDEMKDYLTSRVLIASGMLTDLH